MVRKFNTYRSELECSTEPMGEANLPEKVTVLLASDYYSLEARCRETESRAEMQAKLLREERARIAKLEAALRTLQSACIESEDFAYASIATIALGTPVETP